MTPRKLNKAFALAGISMPSVRAHIESNMISISADLQDATSKELAAIITLHNTAYHQGRASCGAEVIDNDAVWISAGVDKLIPLNALRKIEVIKCAQQVDTPYTHTLYPHCSNLQDAETKEYVSREEFFHKKYCNLVSNYITTTVNSTTHYKLDYTERS